MGASTLKKSFYQHLKGTTIPKILRPAISMKHSAFSSLALRLFGKINGFVLCSFFA